MWIIKKNWRKINSLVSKQFQSTLVIKDISITEIIIITDNNSKLITFSHLVTHSILHILRYNRHKWEPFRLL